MIKFLECPDIHKDPERGDIWDIVSKSILREAREQAVDYVAFPGDFWKAVTTNDNKGGVAEALSFIEELVKICPVCAIEGTPSHDAPGSYEILERAGLVLLKPGKVYGLCTTDVFSGNKKVILNITNIAREPVLDAIFFGAPELSKNNIQSKLNLSAEQANGKAAQLFESYMCSFVAPMRLKYADIPAHMLFHGNVSDSQQENTSDIIMKASDIVIHSEVFQRANLTRISLGHIHKPWESEICNMGYAGSPGLSWGERGFIPAMNLIEIKANNKGKAPGEIFSTLKRLNYGTPERIKVNKASSIKIDPTKAYWLVSETEEPPKGIHPWSRVTKPTNLKRKTDRVTTEEIENVKTLWDLALKLDNTLDERLRPKFDLLEKKNRKEIKEKVSISVDNVEVLGCIFFDGERAYIDYTSMNPGLTAIGGEINGKCNGIGKSGIASFSSPYPTVVGKDTESGRTSALKDFFNQKDSKITKNLTVNGVHHQHIITVKAAHTKSGGKVECYLNIDGKPYRDKTMTFDEMQETCESLYGSYQDYLLTSFYVQPLQGKSGSSLMSESMTTIRDLVQNIAGIDRSSERRMALDEVKKLEDELKGIDIKIQTMEENLADKEPILQQISELQEQIKIVVEDITNGNNKELALKSEIEILQEKVKYNDNQKRILNDRKLELTNIELNINSTPDRIANLEQKLSTIEKDKEILKQHEKDVNSNRDYQIYDNYITARNSLNIKLENLVIPNREELDLQVKEYQESINNKNDNTETVNNYNKSLQDYVIAMSNYNHSVDSLKSAIKSQELDIKSKEDLIAVLNKPCEHCGKLSSKADEDIKKIDDELSTIVSDRLKNINKLSELKFELTEPEYPKLKPTIEDAEDNLQLCKSSLSNIVILESQKKNIENDINMLIVVPKPTWDKKTLQPDFIIDNIKRRVAESEQDNISLHTLKNELVTAQKRKAELVSEIGNIIIDTEIDGELQTKQAEIDNLRQILTDKKSTGSRLQAEIKALEDNLVSIDAQKQKINDMKNGIASQFQNKEDWEEIAKLLGSNKIPALELDIKLEAIDNEATRILEPYQDGQYSFNTTTQQPGKKKGEFVDKFDIKIHDNMTGLEKSFIKFSPGVKAVYNDAYVKSLLQFRNEYDYNPIVFDESDNPVNPKHIGEYYRIQENYFKQDQDKKVLVISQKTEAKAYIENYIDIKEIRCHK